MKPDIDAVWLAIGWTMLHFLWVGGLIGILSAMVLQGLRRASAELRYSVALASLAMLALAPIVIGWRTSQVIGGGPSLVDPSIPNLPVVSAPLVRDVEPAPAPVGRMDIAGPMVEVATPVGPGLPAATAPPARFTSRLDTAAAWLPWLWLVGSPITFAWLALGLAGAERLRRVATVTEGELSRLCGQLSQELGIARMVAIAACDRIAAPVLVGIVRPMILLPTAALGGWSPEQLEMILLHELAHVRRWDNLVNLIQRLVESALFFHPAVWIVSAWVRREREHCCDGIVVASTGRARAYVETLLALADAEPDRTARAAVAMARNDLVARVGRILNLEPKGHAMKLPRGLIALTAAVLILPAGLTISRGRAIAPTAEAQVQVKKDESKATSQPTPGANGPATVQGKNVAGPRDSVKPTVKEQKPVVGPPRIPVRLVDTQGRPVAGAVANDFFFHDADHDPDFTPPVPKEAPVSDERGELVLKLEVPEDVNVAAVYAIRRDGDQRLVGTRRVTREEIRSGKPVTVEMHPACRVRLRVEVLDLRELGEKFQVDTRGANWWRAAYVWLGENRQAPRPLFATSTRGELEFFLPPGRYLLWAYGSATEVVERVIEVQPGQRVLSLGVIEVALNEEFKKVLDAEKLAKSLRPPRMGVLLKGRTEGARDVAFSPDARLLASSHQRGTNPGEVKLWDPATGEEVATLSGGDRGIRSLAFSPDGKLLAGRVYPLDQPTTTMKVALWDVASRRELRTLGDAGLRITAMAFSPDGRMLATCGSDRTVRFLDVASGRETRRIDGMGLGQALAFSPDGRTLALNGADEALILWDIAGNRVSATLEPASEKFTVTSVSFSPDGRSLAARGCLVHPDGSSGAGRAWLYDLTQAPPARRTQLVPTHGGRAGQTTDWISAIAFTSDGQRVVGVMCEMIMIWDAATGAPQDSFRHGPAGLNDRLALAPDGRSLAITQEVGMGVSLFDISPAEKTQAGKEIKTPFKVPNVNIERRGFTGY
jgi:WD40 repeat protein/beta-lactamase regulating signal transducer with metallopeptidase domain